MTPRQLTGLNTQALFLAALLIALTVAALSLLLQHQWGGCRAVRGAGRQAVCEFNGRFTELYK